MQFIELKDDALIAVAVFLDDMSLFRLAHTCRRFYYLFAKSHLWKKFFPELALKDDQSYFSALIREYDFNFYFYNRLSLGLVIPSSFNNSVIIAYGLIERETAFGKLIEEEHITQFSEEVKRNIVVVESLRASYRKSDDYPPGRCSIS